jgi:hypothetical protein
MPKQYNIRWSENDLNELKRSVKNFNAKVKRLEAKYKNSDVILPERMSVKELKKIVTTRRDLQRELKSLQSFTERGSEQIVDIPNTNNNIQMTKWQREEMSRRAKMINDKRYYRRQKLESQPLSNKGKPLGYTRGDIGMGKVEANQLKPTKAFTKGMDKYSVAEKMKHLLKESQSDYWKKRDILMRENYIDALEDNFNPKDIKDIVKKIREMDINKFKETLLSDPEDFNTAYPMNDEEYQAYLTHLRSMWTPQPKPKTKKRAGKR